jgi:hypothetical protein
MSCGAETGALSSLPSIFGPPLQVNRLLVVGRDAVHRVAEQFVAKRQALIEKAAGPHGGGQHPPFGHPPPL